MKHLKTILPVILLSTMPHAEDLCSDSRYASLSVEQCITTGAGIAGGLGSGIYAAVKFGKAGLIESSNTVPLFESKISAVVRVADVEHLGDVQNGDKITVNYELSEAENRAYHIDLMETKASSAEASARFHQLQSMTAMRTETHYGSKGQVQSTSVVPDYAARAMHASLAIDYDSQARDYDMQARNARNGGPIPTHDFNKVIDVNTESRARTEAFIRERMQSDSKIRYINRLPAKFNSLAKKATRRAFGGVAGVLASFIFAGEEIMSGFVADKIKNGLPIDIEMKSYYAGDAEN